MILVEEEVQWVKGHHKGDEEGGEIEEVLPWVHAEAGPRARVVRFVMERVHVAIQECADVPVHQAVLDVPPRMHSTMHKEEVDSPHLGGQREHEHEPQQGKWLCK